MDDELKEMLIRLMLRLKKIGLGLQMSEFMMMRDIEMGDSGKCSGDLHTNLYVTKPAVSQMLRVLEKKGYICREPYITDRRRIVIKITAKGRSVSHAMQLRIDNILSELVERFGIGNTHELIRLFNCFADIFDDLSIENTINTVNFERIEAIESIDD